MGCNSCSNITLPGNAGSQGAQGAQGQQGPIGATGPAGPSASVIDIDTINQYITEQSFPTTAQKVVTIPADTWSAEDDMVELELFFQSRGKADRNDQSGIKIEIDGAPVDIYTGNSNNELDFLDDLNVSPNDNNLIKIRLQFPCFTYAPTVARIRPNIEASTLRGTTVGYESYSIMSPAQHLMGTSSGIVALVDPVDATTISLFMKRGGSVDLKLIYYKLLSYKKIV